MRLFLMIALIAFVSAPLFAQKSESESAGKSGSSQAKAEVKVVGAKGVKVVKTGKACEGEGECEAEAEVKLPEAVQKVVDAIREKMNGADEIDIEAEVDGYKIHAKKRTSESGDVDETLDISHIEEGAEEIDLEDLPEDIRKIVEDAIEECHKTAKESGKTEGESTPKKATRKKEGSK